MVPIKFGQGGSGLEFLDLDDLHGSPQREEVAKARLVSLRQPRSLAPSRLLCSIRSVATIAEPPTPFAFNRFPHCLTRGGSPHFAVLNVCEQSAQRIACYSINGISKQYESCIEACHECVTECEHCAVSCLHEQDIKMMVRFIELVRNCADMCSLAAQFMSRGSTYAGKLCALCADICQACGDECAKRKNEHCQPCAKACHKCAEECQNMAKT